MKIKHHDIIINSDNPFAECRLAREPFARILTDIINTYADGFVMAINNEWGTGKTTFVKMWKQQLKNEGFQTIYFNAWENDFDSNPLVALMSELKTLSNNQNQKLYKSVLEKGSVLVKNVGPAFLKAIANKYIDTEIITSAIENVTRASTEILEEEIKGYLAKKKTLVEFREDLEKFIKRAENTSPLVFIVDELDRCRPNYAVDVLEQIKHFFSVPGIVFILSIDKKHLGAAIKGVYGSENINSDEYLRRFIDLEYSIPKPTVKDFIKYLFEYYSFKDFFSSEQRLKYYEFRNDSENFLVCAEFLLSMSNATLRQQERIFALTRLILCSFKNNQYSFPNLLFVLVYFKTMHIDIFQKIERHEFTLQELSNKFFETVNPINSGTNGINLIYIESLLLWFYNNDSEYQDRIKLLEKDELGNLIAPIKSKLDNNSGRSSLAQCFENIAQQWTFDSMGLNYLIKKVNLTESVTIQ